MIDKQRIVFRADGNQQIGFGHIYRLLALADILRDQFYLTFACYKTDSFIEDEIKNACNEIYIIRGLLPYKTPDDITSADEISFDLDNILQGNEIVVLDGYYFGPAYQRSVKQKGCKLVCIDDLALRTFFADAIINHAPGITPAIYKLQDYTQIYTGLDYAILRQPFFNPERSNRCDQEDVFISMGGSDYFHLTSKLVKFVEPLEQFNHLHIMYSSSYPEEMINDLFVVGEKSGRVTLYKNLKASEIVQLMDKCTYAFVSASTVLLEAYSRGLICFTGFYTNNQLFVYNGFIKEHKAIGLGNLKELTDTVIRDCMYEAVRFSKSDFNKSAVSAAPENIKDIFIFCNLTLRKATATDAALYFEWANDETVRKNSINHEPIKWEMHTAWFEDKLRSNKSKLFVLEYSNKPIGQIRVDFRNDGCWIISFSIDRNFRGIGFGKKIVRLLIEKEPFLQYVAFVKINNFSSCKSFERNGFLLKTNEQVDNEVYKVFEYSK